MKTDNMKNVVIWGDSVAKGVVLDDVKGRYVITKDSAAATFAAKTGVNLINRSRMGMTSADGQKQLEYDMERGIVADTALIGFGGNDSDFDWSAVSQSPDAEHLPKSTLPVFESNMRSMIEALLKRNVTVVVPTLPPVLSEKYFAFFTHGGISHNKTLNGSNILRWLGGYDTIASFHDRYSEVIRRLVKEYALKPVDLFSAFSAQKDLHSFYCSDGIHPNEKGQKLIARVMLETLLPA
ncbi:MAG: SGNH/GDSL hydrolase family protein [Clostridia bacterium]|nr:SGNH/GDSL hydrolase family protein [Clostridia bacterium]